MDTPSFAHHLVSTLVASWNEETPRDKTSQIKFLVLEGMGVDHDGADDVGDSTALRKGLTQVGRRSSRQCGAGVFTRVAWGQEPEPSEVSRDMGLLAPELVSFLSL